MSLTFSRFDEHKINWMQHQILTATKTRVALYNKLQNSFYDLAHLLVANFQLGLQINACVCVFKLHHEIILHAETKRADFHCVVLAQTSTSINTSTFLTTLPFLY